MTKKYLITKETFWLKNLNLNIFGLLKSGLTLILIQQSISAYLSYSVTSKHGTIYQSPAEFPTIIICAGNAFLTGNSIWLFNELAYNLRRLKFFYFILLFIYFEKNMYLDIKQKFCLDVLIIKLAKMYAANPSHEDENRKKLDLSIN